MKPKSPLSKITESGSDAVQSRHDAATALLRDAAVCDQAVEKAAKGDYRTAYEIVQRLIESGSSLKPRAVEIAVRVIDAIADEYIEERNYESAIEWLDKWLSLEPEALYPAVAKADLLWVQLERPQEALPLYRAVVRRHPRCLEGWVGLAQIAFAQGRNAQALRYIRRAWMSLSEPTWAFSPPTQELVRNVLESLYVATAKVFAALGESHAGVDLLRRAVSDWGGSEYLTEWIETLEKRFQSDDERS